MYAVMFKDNWDAHDDNWYALTERDFSTVIAANQFIDRQRKVDRSNGEENRWAYTVN